MSRIQAAVCRQFGEPLKIETLELRTPLANEIEAKLGAVAICHSDIAFAEGLWGGDLPAVYGHEAAGVVTEIGASVRGIRVGDHVIITLIRACGHCVSCAAGQPTSCEKPQDTSASPLSDQGRKILQQGMAWEHLLKRSLLMQARWFRFQQNLLLRLLVYWRVV